MVVIQQLRSITSSDTINRNDALVPFFMLLYSSHMVFMIKGVSAVNMLSWELGTGPRIP